MGPTKEILQHIMAIADKEIQKHKSERYSSKIVGSKVEIYIYNDNGRLAFPFLVFEIIDDVLVIEFDKFDLAHPDTDIEDVSRRIGRTIDRELGRARDWY